MQVPMASPEEVGVDPVALDALRTRVRREIDEGRLPACQFAIAREGKVVAFETHGAATNDTRFLLFSSTKPVVASAVWHLLADGSLSIDKRVADYLPEFATNGKDVVTVEQVLLHTSGFPHAPLGPRDWGTPEGRSAAFARWRLNWEPGSQFEYHATSAHWVLVGLIEAVTGEDYRDFIHTRVTEPLGLPRLLGIPMEDQDDIAGLQLCGEPVDPDELEAILGIRELPVTEVTDEALLGFNVPATRAQGVPGGGGIATAATMALFYQGLLHNPGALWDPEILQDVTTNIRNRFPDVMAMSTPANRSLGLVIAGDDGFANYRGFGKTNTPAAFGHNGAAGQLAWADPGTGLSFCYVTSGRDLNILVEGRRSVGIASRAAVCVS